MVLSCRTLHVRSLEPPSRGSDTSQNVELIDDATRDAVLSRVVFRCGRASLSRDGWRYESSKLYTKKDFDFPLFFRGIFIRLWRAGGGTEVLGATPLLYRTSVGRAEEPGFFPHTARPPGCFFFIRQKEGRSVVDVRPRVRWGIAGFTVAIRGGITETVEEQARRMRGGVGKDAVATASVTSTINMMAVEGTQGIVMLGSIAGVAKTTAAIEWRRGIEVVVGTITSTAAAHGNRRDCCRRGHGETSRCN